jgi:putative aldouronate transport system permease protein
MDEVEGMERVAPQVSGELPAKRKRGFVRLFKLRWEYLVMILPGLIVLLINNYIPMFGIIIAFKNYKMMGNFFENVLFSPLPVANGQPNFFGNFYYLFKGKVALEITRNTVGYNIIFIVIGLVAAVAFAIMLSEIRNRRTSKVYQSLMFLPYFLSWVVVSYLAYSIFGPQYGFVNKSILEPLGIKAQQFYAQPAFWPFILVFFNLWKYTGYNTVVYLAAITAIDPELYEAATIDGASRWQRIKNITLPQLQPLMIILTVLAIGRVFNSDFGLFFQLPRSQGVLFPVTETIDTYVYRALRLNNAVGMAAAAGLYQSVVGFAFVITANWVVKKLDSEKSVF